MAQGAWGTSGNGPTNPQELNRYSYGLNNPIRNTDPTGHCAEVVSCTIAGGTAGTFVCGPLCGVAGAAGAAIVSAAIIYGGYVLATATPEGASSNSGELTGASGGDAGDYHLPGDVPNSHVVVRGGTSDLPEPGAEFSGSHGPTIEDAAAGVPHGTVRDTTAGVIRAGGGMVEVAPEPAYPNGPINPRHVNVRTGGNRGGFSDPKPNPVPKADRVPSRPKPQ